MTSIGSATPPPTPSKRSPECSAPRPASPSVSRESASALMTLLPVTSMISVEEARERILAFFSRLPVERKPLLEALGQVLAEDVVAPFDIPPLDNTSMDGYAVRFDDTTGASEVQPRVLKVTADLAAGYILDTPVRPGEAVRIMTGAPIPPGADAIVPFEETDEPLRGVNEAAIKAAFVRIFKAAEAGANIRYRAE